MSKSLPSFSLIYLPFHSGTEAVTAAPKDKQPLVFDRSGLNDLYDLDIRTIRGKSKGPTTAAELMALAQAHKKVDSHRDIREQEINAQRTAERLKSRMARREREKSAPLAVLPKRPEPKAARASDSQPEPKQVKPAARPRATKGTGKSIEKQLSSALFPTYIAANFAEPPPPAKKIAAVVPKEPAASNVAKPGLILLSDEDRVRLEAEQKKKEALEHEKQVAAKALRRQEQSKYHNERKKQKETVKAREKQRVKLIEEAEKNGVELSKVELMSKLEDFMDKREVSNPFYVLKTLY